MQVGFKIKTTAPRQYCVRPNAQILKPGESQEVKVLLTPMEKLPPENYVCKDKFLVQSITCGDDELEGMTMPEFWVCMYQPLDMCIRTCVATLFLHAVNACC